MKNDEYVLDKLQQEMQLKNFLKKGLQYEHMYDIIQKQTNV